MKTDQLLHPEAMRQPTWKPLFFHPLYILFLTTLHILHIVGIQLLVKKYNDDGPELSLVRQNVTVMNPPSIFIFDENSENAFLAWQYLPVAIATLLGIFWESLDVTVRRLEPFHQLSRNDGGNSANAMCMDYITMFSIFVPFSAIRNRHYAVAASSSVYIMAAVVIPTLTGGIWSVEWASLSYSSEKTEGPKLATISINSGIVITTQVFHGLIATLGITLSWILFIRRTGLYRDPKGIGGIASLISEADHSGSNTLRLFHQLPSFAHSKVLAGSLQGITFQLRHLPIVQGNGTTRMTYQLATNTHPAHTLPLRHEDRAFCQNHRDAMGWWLSRRAVWCAECFLWLGQAAIAGVIYQTAKVVGPNGFADRIKPTIAKVVYTLCITIGGMMWQGIQREVQLFEPWRRLGRGQGRSIYEALVRSDVVSLGLLGSTALSLVRGSLVALWASFSVLMVNVATVFCPPLFELVYAAGLISGSPFQRHEVGIVQGSKALAFGAAGVGVQVVIFCNLVFLLGSGRTRPFLPRRPTTIASQIVYLCHSEKLLADFAGTSMVSNGKLAQKLRHVDQTCRFGWFWWQRGQAWYVGVEEYYGQGDIWAPFDFRNGIYGFQPCT